jgi:hypothetical protein
MVQVTICTATFNIQKFYTLPTQCMSIYMSYVFLRISKRTVTDTAPLTHKLTARMGSVVNATPRHAPAAHPH